MNLEELFDACKKDQLPTVKINAADGGIGSIVCITTYGIHVRFPWLPYNIFFGFQKDEMEPKMENRTIEELSIVNS